MGNIIVASDAGSATGPSIESIESILQSLGAGDVLGESVSTESNMHVTCVLNLALPPAQLVGRVPRAQLWVDPAVWCCG